MNSKRGFISMVSLVENGKDNQILTFEAPGESGSSL